MLRMSCKNVQLQFIPVEVCQLLSHMCQHARDTAALPAAMPAAAAHVLGCEVAKSEWHVQCSCSCTVAAAVEGRDTVLILHCNSSSGELSQQQEVQLPGVSLPTQVAYPSLLLSVCQWEFGCSHKQLVCSQHHTCVAGRCCISVQKIWMDRCLCNNV